MKQLTIHIPDNKFQFVLDVLSRLKFIKIDGSAEDPIITPEQKKLVKEEIRKMKNDPSYGLDWDEVKHLLTAD